MTQLCCGNSVTSFNFFISSFFWQTYFDSSCTQWVWVTDIGCSKRKVAPPWTSLGPNHIYFHALRRWSGVYGRKTDPMVPQWTNQSITCKAEERKVFSIWTTQLNVKQSRKKNPLEMDAEGQFCQARVAIRSKSLSKHWARRLSVSSFSHLPPFSWHQELLLCHHHHHSEIASSLPAPAAPAMQSKDQSEVMSDKEIQTTTSTATKRYHLPFEQISGPQPHVLSAS